MRKLSLSILSCITAMTLITSVIEASPNVTELSPTNTLPTGSNLSSKLAQLKLKDYNSVQEFEKDFSEFIDNVVSVKSYEDFSNEEKEKWDLLLINFNMLQLSMNSGSSFSTNANATYDNLQRDIEGSIVTAKYGAAVTLGVSNATNKANTEQTTYKNSHGFSSTQENEVDAFRHFSWNYHLTNTAIITRGMAKEITDNHEFSAFGTRYAQNNFANSTAAVKVAQGVYYTKKIKNETTTSSSFKSKFINSNFMDFNNNEAGRAYESKGYSSNFTAFAAALSSGHVTTSPSQWTASKLSDRAYNIYNGSFKY